MQGIHWAQRTAKALVAAHPNLDTFVCAAGISPENTFHVGNFREVVTTYFVVRALQELGKKTRFIFSWDDFDRFRAVPKGVDPSFAKYSGMPYSAVPDPHGCCKSYAAHIENEFETTLKAFGIPVEFLYQTQQYQSGRYREGIHQALVSRHRIYDILKSFNSQAVSQVSANAFYPVNLYCEKCGKDHTSVSAYDEGARILYYSCPCSHQGVQSVREATTIKLIWKVDWPMRWREEQVVFEPGGRNHSAAAGSYNVSTVIAREIFNYTSPAYIPYETIAIKRAVETPIDVEELLLTPRELLKVYSPEVILSLFFHHQPQSPMSIHLDDEVILHHSGFERMYHQWQEGKLTREEQRLAMQLCQLPQTPERFAPFAQLANVLPLVENDRQISRELLGAHMDGVTSQTFHSTCDRVQHWIKTWHPERRTRINRSFNRAYYVSLSAAVKDQLKGLVSTLTPDSTGEAWLEAVYRISGQKEANQVTKQSTLILEAIYQLLISRAQGPKLPLLIDLMGTHNAYRLLAGTVR